MAGSVLRVGVYQGPEIPQSFRVYAENVQRYLPRHAIQVIPFDTKNLPTSVDVLWDIRSGGGNPPPDFLLGNQLPPLVVTVHGFAPVTLNGWEYFRTLKGLIMSSQYAKRKRAKWREARASVAAIIAVSAFVKEEAVHFTGIPAEKIHVCHHGVDTEVFKPYTAAGSDAVYFFHVSNDEPRKNINRMLQAFRQVRCSHDVQLVLKLPEHAARNYAGIDGVRVLSGLLAPEKLADFYRCALAFVFPSLYEGFGMPIVEAMACGCPVITSNVSACPEVAGEAAITVDPRDEEALREAMLVSCRSPELRAARVTAGLRRARDFSWEKSAQCHANVLRTAAGVGC